jgi:peptide chain release factor 2
LEQRIAAPGFWDDRVKAKTAIDEANRHRAILKPFGELETTLADVGLMLDLASSENDEAQRKQALAEADSLMAAADAACRKLELESLLSGELDANNAYLTLHAGAGGTEACDWVDMLLRMYLHYCKDRGFETEILEYAPGEEAGAKRVAFHARGTYAYGYLRAERGVHRLVRISPFDANKRRHTTFAALDVAAEISEDVEVDIQESDLRVDTYRSGGAGGQHVNTTDSAVRITHAPTGIVVACQAERSQHMNRAKAYAMLRARLYELELERKKKNMEKCLGEKGEIAWGNQIRSYVLQPYTLAKDHRTNVEIGNVQAVLDGRLHEFVEAYLKKAAWGVAGAGGATPAQPAD